MLPSLLQSTVFSEIIVALLLSYISDFYIYFSFSCVKPISTKINIFVYQCLCFFKSLRLCSVNALRLYGTGIIIWAAYSRHGRLDAVRPGHIVIRPGDVLKAVITMQDRRSL